MNVSQWVPCVFGSMLSFVSDPVPWAGRPVTGTLEREDYSPDPSGVLSPWFSPGESQALLTPQVNAGL